MRRVGSLAVRGTRGLHSTAPAGAGISFANVVSKVTNETDKLRLQNLQKVHDDAKVALGDVSGEPEAIDFASWSANIGDQAVVAEIKAALDAVSLPDAGDTTMVEHPAWDQAEFQKLAASLNLQNEETAADLKKLQAYSKYLGNLPPVSEMTVEDVLGKNSDLDYSVQRQMDEIEVRAFSTIWSSWTVFWGWGGAWGCSNLRGPRLARERLFLGRFRKKIRSTAIEEAFKSYTNMVDHVLVRLGPERSEDHFLSCFKLCGGRGEMAGTQSEPFSQKMGQRLPIKAGNGIRISSP